MISEPDGRLRPPSVAGVVTSDDMLATARTIIELQLPTGMIQWFPGGHTDPWNHVEAAMALATCGFERQAEAAYQWLVDIQRPDGSWHNYYTETGITDAKLDANCVAYFATGIWHHYLATDDVGVLDRFWPTVQAAVDFVIELQTRRGEIIWARHPDGTPWSYALLTGSSSISHSLGCAIEIAGVMGRDRPEWEASRAALVDVILHQPDAFEPKDRWAMDWYYPVLAGAVVGDDAGKLLASRWDDFVMEGKGVRCVSDRPWVTAAETCECVIAHVAAGERSKATDLFTWANALRDDDGRYFTGMVYPELVHFPDQERSAYTAAAVILAADALEGANPTSTLFLPGRSPVSGSGASE
jgi:hypothetical protein